MSITLSPLQLIQFRYNRYIRKYPTDHYKEKMTDGRVSKKEVDDFLRNVEKIISTAPRAWTMRRCAMLYGLLWIAVIIAIPIVVTQSDSSAYLPLFLTSGLVLFFGGCLVVCYGLRHSLRRGMKNPILVKRVQDYVDNQNPKFESRGIRWNLPPSFPDGIELWKDYMLKSPTDKIWRTEDINVNIKALHRAGIYPNIAVLPHRNVTGHLPILMPGARMTQIMPEPDVQEGPVENRPEIEIVVNKNEDNIADNKEKDKDDVNRSSVVGSNEQIEGEESEPSIPNEKGIIDPGL